MKNNMSIWLGYCVLAVVFVFAESFLTMQDSLWVTITAAFSAGLAGWLAKIHKGSDDFWKAGFLTWCFFTLGLAIRFLIEPLLESRDAASHVRPDLIFVGISSIFSMPAILLTTGLVDFAVLLMRKSAKAPAK